MSQMIKNSDGSETEVFTADEVKAAEKKATETATEAAQKTAKEGFDTQLEEYKKENPSGAEEIGTLKKDIETKEAKIKELEGEEGGEGEGDKDKHGEQINRLKKEAEEGKKELEGKIETMGKQLQDVVGDTKDGLIKKAAGGDEELQKKIELHYDSFKGDVVTKSDIITRVESAFKLAADAFPVSFFSSFFPIIMLININYYLGVETFFSPPGPNSSLSFSVIPKCSPTFFATSLTSGLFVPP